MGLFPITRTHRTSHFLVHPTLSQSIDLYSCGCPDAARKVAAVLIKETPRCRVDALSCRSQLGFLRSIALFEVGHRRQDEFEHRKGDVPSNLLGS